MRIACFICILSFACVASAANVKINQDNVLEIDGKKTLLIAFIMPPAPGAQTPWGKNGIEELADAGATFLRTGPMGKEQDWTESFLDTEQKWQDAAAKYGLHCLMGLKRIANVTDSKPENEALLRKVIARFKDHPGMGAWYHIDEPEWGKHPVPPLVDAYKLIHQLDGHHPVWICHAPRGTVESLRKYLPACDATGMDVYPIGYPPGTHGDTHPNKEISMVGDFTRMMNEVTRDKKPLWMCLQIAWSGVTNPGKTLRFPTLPEERFMTYDAIINGARGVIYFGGQLPMTLNDRDKPLGWNWTFWERVLRPVVEEIGTKSPLYPALVAPDSKMAIKAEFPLEANLPLIEYRVREVGNDIFILAAKHIPGNTVKIKFTNLPNVAPEAEVMFEPPRKVKIENNSFTDWFAPFDVHVYRLRRS